MFKETRVNLPLSKAALITYMAQGHKVKFLPFWGHQNNKDGVTGKGCLSQWYDMPFSIADQQYQTAEHYMMAEKARLFGDDDTLTKILHATHPGEAKRLGRTVKHYSEARWREHRFDIVVSGNLAKFSQNEALKAYLLASGNRILVEASPKDLIWGIGMDEHHPDVANPSKWRGLNLLGFALMVVRDQFRTHQSGEKEI